MPKLKPEELETRRREIIDAARTCFLRSGFHRTTTDEICREASITPGGLYHYFGSKEELISAVIERSAEGAVERMKGLIAEAMDAESAFRQVSAFFFQAIQDPDFDNATRLEMEVWVEGLKNERLFEKSRKAWTMRMGWLEALIKRGVEDGIYDAKVVEPHALACLMISIFIGLRLGKLLNEDFDTAGAVQSLFLMHAGKLHAANSNGHDPGGLNFGK